MSLHIQAHVGKHGYKGEVDFTASDLHDPDKWAAKAELLRLQLISFEDRLKQVGYKDLDDGQEWTTLRSEEAED